MRTVSILTRDDGQTITLPEEMAYTDVSELEITRIGDTITLRPIRPDWLSFARVPVADAAAFEERPAVIDDEGRCSLIQPGD